MFDTIILLAGQRSTPLCRTCCADTIRSSRSCRWEPRPIWPRWTPICSAGAADCVRDAGNRLEEHSREAGLWRLQLSPGTAELPGWRRRILRSTSAPRSSARPSTSCRAGRCRSDRRRRDVPHSGRISVLALEGLAYAHLAQLFCVWRNRWRPIRKRCPRVQSNGQQEILRRAYRQICDIPLDIPKDELERRLSVFGGNHFGMCPTINLHGVEFRAVLPQSSARLCTLCGEAKGLSHSEQTAGRYFMHVRFDGQCR